MSGASLLVAPTNAGLARAPGLRLGPDAILARLTAIGGATSEESGWDVRRLLLGDDAVTGARTVTVATAACVTVGGVPLVVGGDHTVAAGSIAGVWTGLRAWCGRDVPLYLLWLDAHPDLNVPATSPSGNLHGMVLAGVLGAGPLALDTPLPPARIVLAGARDFDPGERAFLSAHPGLRQWSVAALQGDGWRLLLSALLDEIAGVDGRLYVSLDLDVLDPRSAPGVAVPVANGASPAAVLGILQQVRRSALLAGADVVEHDPTADRDHRTAEIAARALRTLAGAPSIAQGSAVSLAA